MPRSLLLACALLLACGPVADMGAVSSSESSADPTTPDLPTTTAEPTTTTTTGLDGGATQSLDFISHFDLTPEECDVWAQNCPEGQKCVPWAEGGSAWNALKCVDITGDGAPGDPCITPAGPLAGIDDCALGSICWDVDDTNHGTCIGQCSGTPDAPVCPAIHNCSIWNDGVLNLCFPWCDPLTQDCPSKQVCLPVEAEFRCIFDTAESFEDINGPCEFINQCDKGLICIPSAGASAACNQEANGCCQPFCKLPNAPCPNPDQLCLPWFDPMLPIPPGYEDLGFCGIPE